MEKSTFITYMLSNSFHVFAGLLGFILAGTFLSTARRAFPTRCVGVGVLWLTCLHAHDHVRFTGSSLLFSAKHMSSKYSSTSEFDKLHFLSVRVDYAILILCGVTAFVLAIIMTAKLASAYQTQAQYAPAAHPAPAPAPTPEPRSEG